MQAKMKCAIYIRVSAEKTLDKFLKSVTLVTNMLQGD